MRKVLRIVRNIIFGVFLVIYLSIIIGASTLVLKRNDFGYTQFGNKSLIDIKEDTNNYTKGQLVVVETKSIENLKAGDEVFIYQTNQTEKTVKVVSSTIKEVITEESNPYITIDLDNSAWGQDYIAGQMSKVYNKVGGVLTFVESKWIFFVIFIVPCFFILLYEIYSVIIVIKFEGGDVAAMETQAAAQSTQPQGGDNLSSLMNEINNLKSQLNQNVQSVPNTASVEMPAANGVQQVAPDVSTIGQQQNITSQVMAQTQVPNPETIVIPQPQVVQTQVAQPVMQQAAQTPVIQPIDANQQQVVQQVQPAAQPQIIEQAPTPTIQQSEPVIINQQVQQPVNNAQAMPQFVVPNESATPTIIQSIPNSTTQNNNQVQNNNQSNQEIL